MCVRTCAYVFITMLEPALSVGLHGGRLKLQYLHQIVSENYATNQHLPNYSKMSFYVQ